MSLCQGKDDRKVFDTRLLVEGFQTMDVYCSSSTACPCCSDSFEDSYDLAFFLMKSAMCQDRCDDVSMPAYLGAI